MVIIPKILLKKIYVAGSLRQTAEGIAFDFINAVGPGILTKLNKIMLNETEFTPEKIVLKVGDVSFPGDQISETNPATVAHNQIATCIIRGASLAEGLHKITLDLLSREVGKIVFSVEDSYQGDPA